MAVQWEGKPWQTSWREEEALPGLGICDRRGGSRGWWGRRRPEVSQPPERQGSGQQPVEREDSSGK